MTVGRAQYTGLMYPEGTFVDDVLVHKMADDEYLLVVNAANRHKDFAYLSDLARDHDGVEVVGSSDDYAQIALQGPLAAGGPAAAHTAGFERDQVLPIRRPCRGGRQARPPRPHRLHRRGRLRALSVDPSAAPEVWRAILAEGAPQGVQPAGLGARDTLRFEAGMCFYGNDIDETTTPLEAGLGWIVKLGKGDFIGRDVLERQKEEGVERARRLRDGGPRHRPPRLPGDARGRIGRDGRRGDLRHPVADLGKALGMVYLPTEVAQIGREFFVEGQKPRRPRPGGGASVLLTKEV